MDGWIYCNGCIVCKYPHSEANGILLSRDHLIIGVRSRRRRVTDAHSQNSLRAPTWWQQVTQSHHGPGTRAIYLIHFHRIFPTFMKCVYPDLNSVFFFTWIKWDIICFACFLHKTEKKNYTKVFNLHFCLLVFFVTVVKLVCNIEIWTILRFFSQFISERRKKPYPINYLNRSCCLSE